MIEDFDVDTEVTVKMDVLHEFQKNKDLEYKYSYKRMRNNKRLKKSTVYDYGFDDPDDIVDDDEW